MSDWRQWILESVALARLFPWLLLLAVALPFLVLSRRRTFPHLPLLLALLVPCLVSIATVWIADVLLLVVLGDALILTVAILDLWTLPSPKSFSASRELARVASIRTNHRVTLTINNLGSSARSAAVRDDVPPEFDALPDQFQIHLKARSRTTLHYEFKANRRGAFQMQFVHLRIRSRLGLWRKYISIPVESSVHVYPDMKQLGEYAVLARTNRLSLMGVRRTRKIGTDNEFERLRDYSRDDNYKHIDWRTTARRRKLTVKDFQSNQSQRIVFLVDCGRMMTNEAAGLSLLDHALNSMLMLSYVALRQGDSVGLLCFSDQVHTYVPLRSGMSQMNHLLHASFDRFPKLVESRYDEAFLYLTAHCRKRSLVILITNLIDDVNANQIDQYLGSLVGRHLPLGVLLRDHRLFDVADLANPQGDDLYRAAAAAQILTWRHQVLTELQHKGVLSLDLFPEDMTAPLVNEYLDIKARHLL